MRFSRLKKLPVPWHGGTGWNGALAYNNCVIMSVLDYLWSNECKLISGWFDRIFVNLKILN